MRWLLLLLLTLPAWAQELAAPAVQLTAIMRDPQGGYSAIVKSPDRSYVIWKAQKLGDYVVRSITADSVVFGYRDLKFPIRLAQPVPAGSGLAFSLHDCDPIYALKALARASGKAVLVAPEVEGALTLTAGNLTLNQALTRVVQGPWAWRERGGVLYVGPPSRLERPPVDLPGVDLKGGTKVSLDFVHAQLKYVVQVLAQEMNLKFQIDPSVDGSVTLRTKNVPAGLVLQQILSMQPKLYHVEVREGTLRVTPR